MKSTGHMIGRSRPKNEPVSDFCADICQGAENSEDKAPTSAGWYHCCFERCMAVELEEHDPAVPPVLERREYDGLEAYWCEAGMIRSAECS